MLRTAGKSRSQSRFERPSTQVPDCECVKVGNTSVSYVSSLSRNYSGATSLDFPHLFRHLVCVVCVFHTKT